METLKLNIKSFVDSLDYLSKDALYRYLWAEHVREDVRERLVDYDDISESEHETIIEAVANAYVYDGDYDCELTYWENIDNLIRKMSNR